MELGRQRHVLAALPPGNRPDTHCIGGSVGARAGLDGAENFTTTGIRSPDGPARSETIYRLRCPRFLTGTGSSLRNSIKSKRADILCF
jgi:hypothetical protein